MLLHKSDFIRFGLLVFALNLALTGWTVAFKPVLNYDGILYLSAAQAISEGNWQYASELYKGTFYPYLIHLTATLTTLSLEYSAHLLNSVLLTTMSFGFIAIVYQLGGRSKEILIISALVIVLFPSLLKYRPFIIRDFGFLACYLWSLFFLLKYKQQPHIKHLAIWALILICASLIRIESAAYFSVIAVLLLPWKHLVQNVKWLIFTSLLIVMMIAITASIPSSGVTLELLNSIHPALTYPFQYLDLALSKLDRNLLKHGDANVFITVVSIVWETIYESLRRLEFVYAILAFIAIKKGWALQESSQRSTFIYYILTSIIILTLFTIGALYFSSRYTMAMVLTVLTLAPFTLEKAYQQFTHKTKGLQFALIFFTLILCMLSVKRLVPNDHHLESSAGQWVIKNLPSNVVLASNNSKVLYYANQRHRYLPKKNEHYRFSTEYLLSSSNKNYFENSDYLAFMIKRKNTADVTQEQLFNTQYGTPVSVIKQSDGFYVNIYNLR